MKKIIKKLVLWINKNPLICQTILLTACIPISIIFLNKGWVIPGVIFGVMGVAGAAIWLMIIALILKKGFELLWEKIVGWAEN